MARDVIPQEMLALSRTARNFSFLLPFVDKVNIFTKSCVLCDFMPISLRNTKNAYIFLEEINIIVSDAK